MRSVGRCVLDVGLAFFQGDLRPRQFVRIGAHAMIPPGHWQLFKMAIELAQSGALTPLNNNEREMVRAIAMDSEPIFKKQA